MPQLFNKDQDYLDAGVAPPEHIPHGIPGDDNKDVASMIAATGVHLHHWHSRGTGEIECDRGDQVHGHRVPMDQILVGTAPDGSPIMKTIDLADKKTDDTTNGDARAN